MRTRKETDQDANICSAPTVLDSFVSSQFGSNSSHFLKIGPQCEHVGTAWFLRILVAKPYLLCHEHGCTYVCMFLNYNSNNVYIRSFIRIYERSREQAEEGM